MNIIKLFDDNPNISEEELKRVYHKLARKYHPDYNSSNPEKATKITQQLNMQYAEIKKRIRLRKTPTNNTSETAIKYKRENKNYTSNTYEKKSSKDGFFGKFFSNFFINKAQKNNVHKNNNSRSNMSYVSQTINSYNLYTKSSSNSSNIYKTKSNINYVRSFYNNMSNSYDNSKSNIRNVNNNLYRTQVYRSSSSQKIKNINNNINHNKMLQTLNFYERNKNYIVLENNNGSYLFIDKDYGIKRIGKEKVNKYKVICIDPKNDQFVTQTHEVYGNIDLKQLETNDKYKDYISNELLIKDKLEKISEKLGGYIGYTQYDGKRYKQKCNIKILASINKISNNKTYNFKRGDSSKFSMKKLYSEVVNSKKVDVYLYSDSNDVTGKKEQHIIRTDVNMDRLQVNKIYRRECYRKYFNRNWMKKCIKSFRGYIGAPEEDYKKQRCGLAR